MIIVVKLQWILTFKRHELELLAQNTSNKI